MRKIDILRIIHCCLKDSTVDKISGGLENKNLGLARSRLKDYDYSRNTGYVKGNKFIEFLFPTDNGSTLYKKNTIFYNPELDYCFIGNIQFQLSDLELDDTQLILSYGRSILEEIKS